MAYVITEQSTVQCGHQGTVSLTASQSKLKIGGAAALVDGDLAGKTIAGCITVTDPNTGALQCQTVASAIAGVATKLTVGGKGVLLENIQGQTSGTVGGTPQTWSVTAAGQNQLQTV